MTLLSLAINLHLSLLPLTSQLVHGGVRYLEKAVLGFDYGQVRGLG